MRPRDTARMRQVNRDCKVAVPTPPISSGVRLRTLMTSSRGRSRPNLPVQAPTKYELLINLNTTYWRLVRPGCACRPAQ